MSRRAHTEHERARESIRQHQKLTNKPKTTQTPSTQSQTPENLTSCFSCLCWYSSLSASHSALNSSWAFWRSRWRTASLWVPKRGKGKWKNYSKGFRSDTSIRSNKLKEMNNRESNERSQPPTARLKERKNGNPRQMKTQNLTKFQKFNTSQKRTDLCRSTVSSCSNWATERVCASCALEREKLLKSREPTKTHHVWKD